MLEGDIKDLLVILEESPVGVSVSRRSDGVIVFANHRFTELIGIPRDKFLGTNARDYYVDAAQRASIIGHLKAHGSVDDADVEFRRVDGTPFWTLLTIRPATLNGEAVSLAWIYDISERKRSEHAIAESQALVQAMLDASGDGIALFDLDGSMIGLNTRMAEELRGAPRDLIGSLPWDRLPAEAAAILRREVAEVARNGKPQHSIGPRHGVYYDNRVFPVPNAEGAFDKVALFSRDISRARERDAELRKLSTAVEQAPVSILITDSLGQIEYVNRHFTHVSGYEPDEVIGSNPRIFKSSRNSPDLYKELWTRITSGLSWQGELANMRRDGELYWEYATISPVKDEQGAISHFLAVKENITVRKEYELKLLHQATHDALTGLPNRLLLQDRLGHAIEIARREEKQVALLFIDLDRFKVVNDSLGHDAGDELLKLVAEKLTECLRRSDTVARLGGDEFVVVLSDFQNTGEVAEVAEKIIQRLTEPMVLKGYDVHVGGSIGVSMFPLDGDDVTSLMQGADTAMYRAKAGGRNTFRFFDPEMNGEAVERLNLEAALRRALELGEFELYYQPKVTLKTGVVEGCEALIRWNSPERGLVSPIVFIPLAEETGLIGRIGDWVLEEACRQQVIWQAQGGLPLRVAVNVSGRQFLGDGFADKVGRLLERYGLDASLLEIELTESTVMSDPEKAVLQLQRLREIGVAVSVDDFGTGYSSLSYLKRLPLDTIKVDRSFVRGVDTQSDNAAIVAAILGLGDALGMTIVAEGVETEGEELHLQGAGCQMVQGFKYAKPLPASEFQSWLSEFLSRALV